MAQHNETEFEKAVRDGRLVNPEKILQDHVDHFNLGGGNTPVKVMPTGVDQQQVSGFFTQEKFILGRTPRQMEDDLGLKPGDLINGATIYEISQTPNVEQFVPAGYTHMPGGSYYQEGSEYPVGAGAIQFRLNEALPAKIVGKVGYEESWKRPSMEQKQSGLSAPLSSGSENVLSNSEVSESVGELAGNAVAGPAGGEIGKVAGESARKAQQAAMESAGQSTEDPVKTHEVESSSDEEQNYGYGY
jgi:hypothetical protein